MLVLVIVAQIMTVWYMAAVARLILSDKLPGEALIKVWGEIKNEIWDHHRVKVLLLIGVDLLLAFIAGLLFSHQVAGPSVSLKRDIERFRTGDLLVTFKVRKGDSLQEVVKTLNNTVQVYRNRIRELKRLARELEEHGSSLSPSGGEALQEMKRILGTLQTERIVKDRDDND